MSTFHEGERAVQKRAGVRGLAERVGSSIQDAIPLAAQEFLAVQPMLVVGGADLQGQVWASLLTGEPGFMHARDEHSLRVEAQFPADDPLGEALQNREVALGALAIEPATRRRMRLNGLGRLEDGAMVIQAREVYANCPKYIQKRTWRREVGSEPGNEAPTESGEMRESEHLKAAQLAFIERADTFFIASQAPEGADASHRGGRPGVVRVIGSNLLQFPDYAGNAMFNTLGNLERDGRAGLLFPDWQTGTTLQLSGQARVLWDAEVAATWPGAERAVEFRIERVLERPRATRLQWEFLEASPFNPALG